MTAASRSRDLGLPLGDVLLGLLESSAIACVGLDGAKCFCRWSKAAEGIFGWTEDEILGRPASLLRPEGDLAEGAPGNGRQACELVLRGKEGKRVDARVWVAPAPADERSGFLLLVQDVTETKFLEKALLEAAEREQRRIGQELHDHLCQHLLGAAFSAKALAGAMDREQSRLAPQLHDLARLINEAVSQVRDISRGLHPVELDAAGLMSALQELANRASHSVPTQFRCDKQVLVGDPEVALNAYRIAQEAVSEALQSGGDQIAVFLARKGNSICLGISTNGLREGELTSAPQGAAAKTLHYRAQAMGGTLTSAFDPRTGTSITCHFPYKP